MNKVRMRYQRGFTVIELLIATAIFTVVLILITTGVLQFSREYYKGVITSSTQNTARAIVDDATRAIQFNSGEVYTLQNGGTTTGYCVGESKRYSFALHAQVKDSSPNAAQHQRRHAFVSDNVTGCSSSSSALNVTGLGSTLTTPNARELLGEHMRLAKFSITGTDGLYTINVKVVYGDDDLLCSPTIGNRCGSSGATGSIERPDIRCKSTVGNQFCAVSELSTTVNKRVN